MMKAAILSGWTTWRVIRMLLALIFIVAGATRSDVILLAGGSYLFIQSLFNLGCAGGSCSRN